MRASTTALQRFQQTARAGADGRHAVGFSAPMGRNAVGLPVVGNPGEAATLENMPFPVRARPAPFLLYSV